MSTGYTAYIENDSITTGEDFLKLCARAFGVPVPLGDESLSVSTQNYFEPDSYYKHRYEETLEELEKIKLLSFEDIKQRMRTEFDKAINSYKKVAEEKIELNKKYSKIKAEIESWNPPTAEMQNIKDFALSQIEVSMPKQKDIDAYLKKCNEILDDSDKAVEKYVSGLIQHQQIVVDISYKAYQDDLRKTKEKNEFMEKFLESLNNCYLDEEYEEYSEI